MNQFMPKRLPDPRPLPHNFVPYFPPKTEDDPCPDDYLYVRKFIEEHTVAAGRGEIGRVCEIWQGRPDSPPPKALTFYFYGQNYSVRRTVWLIHHGSIPDKARVFSTCGYKDCVSIHHLELRFPKDAPVGRRTRLTPRIERHILYALRRNVSPQVLADAHNVEEHLVDELVERIKASEGPKSVHGPKRIRMQEMFRRGWSVQDIVVELNVNKATVLQERARYVVENVMARPQRG